ncbi:MAG: hypothetical protein V1774_00045 [Candidatus Eisenbacteria bacterium]
MSISTASVLLGRRAGPARGRRFARGTRGGLGIEAGETWIRLSQLQRKGRQDLWRTLSLQSRGERSASTGRHLLRTAGFRKQRVVCALNLPHLDVFPLTLEGCSGESLEGQIVARAGEQLSYALTDAVLDYMVLSGGLRRPGCAGTTVLVFACPRRLVDDLLARLDALDLAPARLITPACALAASLGASEAKPRRLAICSGDEATSVAVIEQGTVLLERILPWGLQRLAESLAAELSLPIEQSRELLVRPDRKTAEQIHEAGTAPDAAGDEEPVDAAGACAPEGRAREDRAQEDPLEAAMQQILGPALQELVQEASACLGYCDSFLQPVPAADVTVLGAVAHLPALRLLLEQDLGLAVRIGLSGIATPPAAPCAPTHEIAGCCALWPGETHREANP